MRIDTLRLKDFRGFDTFELSLHPEFNLLVGENGSGKTSILEALTVAAGAFLLGIHGEDSRPLREEDIRIVAKEGIWERQPQCIVAASGEVKHQPLTWSRELRPGGRTTSKNAHAIKRIAASLEAEVRQHTQDILPLISSYGVGRLVDVPRAQTKLADDDLLGTTALSRVYGYRTSVDPRIPVNELLRWFKTEELRALQKKERSATYEAARTAILGCMDDATDIAFDLDQLQVVVTFAKTGQRLFPHLSAGQQIMLTLVADIARKAATLNRHLGEHVLRETPGIVLIDELDLHLHPQWQRRVIEDLRRTFPKLQFVCTTHSPFLIQSLRSGEELHVLGGQPFATLGNKSIDMIARGIQGIERPEASDQYATEKAAARSYLELLDEAALAPAEKLEAYKNKLAEGRELFADNPAVQAILEMKRVAKLGEFSDPALRRDETKK